MKPLPAQLAAGGKAMSEPIPSLPTVLAAPAGEYSKANRRSVTGMGQRAYPWLLSASTAVSAIFCLLYITKPVIAPAPTPGSEPHTIPSLATPGTPSTTLDLMPSAERLPGDKTAASGNIKPAATDPRRGLPGSPLASAFEETNLRIQHILTAEAPGGHLDRIDIDVPVLYQSRNLRWTAAEVSRARELLVRLMDYQEKSQALRAEGIALLDTWNQMIGSSIPASDLRADSPSLPTNQEDATDAPRPAGLTTTESIQLQPSGK